MKKKKQEDLDQAQKEAEELHKRTVALEEILLQESSLLKKSGKGKAAAAGSKKTKEDFYIKEAVPDPNKKPFIVDFDEDEVPDLE